MLDAFPHEPKGSTGEPMIACVAPTMAPERTMARSAGGIRQLELDFSAVSAVGRQWHLGRDPGRARGKRSGGRHAADDRCDHHPCASLRGWRKGGTERNALGRSRGGFSTKIN